MFLKCPAQYSIQQETNIGRMSIIVVTIQDFCDPVFLAREGSFFVIVCPLVLMVLFTNSSLRGADGYIYPVQGRALPWKCWPSGLGVIKPIDSWNFLQKMRLLDILVLFKLDFGQISFNSVENAFATQQLAFLAISFTFYHIVTRACAESKGFSIFGIFFWPSFFLLFSSFCCSGWPSTGLACS